ncbi:MAG: PAS domain S-box protein [Deltaproteobacteria bacterium]|nr:MAG: PAS domain S-box protein [Deltaproteobacteria bacterium]
MLKKYFFLFSGISVLIVLYLASLYSYLLFHSIAEIFCVVIALVIFIITWNSKQFIDNTYLLFLGIAFLFFGILDLFHLLAYKGMGVFRGYDANLPTQLWIAEKYVQSLSLLIAPLLLGRRLKIYLVFLGYSFITFILLISIFYWGIFPDCFIEGTGLTLFKRLSEYIICLILLASLYFLYKKRQDFDPEVLRFLLLFIVLNIVTELAFTLYMDVYGFFNLIGHFLQVVAFYLVYLALIETGLKRPYALLYRNLARSEEDLRQAKEELEIKIAERTDELRNANKQLQLELTERNRVEGELAENLRELQETAQRLEESRNLLQLIIESIPARVFWKDRDFRYLGCNTLFARDAGLSRPEQLLGKDDFSMVWREQADLYRADDRQVMESGLPKMNIVEPQTTSRDAKVWVKTSKVPLLLPHGEVFGILGVYEDITARKRSENIMQARLRLLEFANTHSTDELLTATLDEIEELTGSNIGFYHFLEADQKTLSLQNWSTNTLKNMCTAIGKGSHYNVAGAGVWVDCIYARRPVIHNDYASLPHRQGMPQGHAPVVREVVVPIFRANLIKAIIGVGNKASNYDDSDIEIVSQLGDLSWDIVERKRAEEALRESEERFRDLYENAPNAYFSVGTDGLISRCNRRAGELLGYAAKELLGRPVLELYADTAHGKEKAKQVLKRFRSLETVHDEELEMRKMDGATVWVSLTVDAVQDAQGRAIESRSMVVDITERKRAEEALRKSEGRLAQAQRIAHVGYWDRELDTGCVTLSDETCRIFGLPPREGILNLDQWHERWLELIHPEDRLKTSQAAAEALRGGPRYDVEYRVVRLDGEVRFVHSVADVALDELGRPSRLFGVMQDITEYKQAEEALRQTNETLRATLDAAPVAIIDLDTEGRIKSVWNPAAEQMLGWRREEVLGQFLPTVPEESKEEFAGFRAWVCSGKSILGKDVVRHRKDGSPIEYSIYAAPEYNGEGKIIGNIAVLVDITERKQMEQALALKEQEYRTLIENIPDLIVRYDLDLRRIYVNPAWEKASGLSAKDVINKPAAETPHVPHPVVAEYAEKLRQVAKAGTPQAIGFTWVNARGVTLFLEYIIVPEYDRYGKIVSVLAVGRDLTERKRTEDVVAAERQRFYSLLEAMPAYVGLLTPDYRVDFANRYFRERFGEPGRRYCYDYMFGRSEPCENCQAYKVLESKKPEEYEWLGPDGRTYQICDQLVYDTNGSPLILEMGIDITDRKKVEEEIRKLNLELEQRVIDRTAQLEAANQELEAFAYSVSHDLRAPLRHVDGFLELLQKRTAAIIDDTSRHYLAQVFDSTRRMGTLIDDLLSFSRMGRREMLKKPVDLNALVQEVIREFEPEMRDRSIRWQISDLPGVIGDHAMLRMVLANLISNALKFTRSRQQAEIEIGFLPEGNETIIFVRDNGVGFDMNYADNLFGVFQRLHRVEEFEGTGIGLANVRRIINRHGGRTWAEGKLDQGATIYFSLP